MYFNIILKDVSLNDKSISELCKHLFLPMCDAHNIHIKAIVVDLLTS
jgi:hypothetical protein